MSHYFLDSSALIKRYVAEPGAAWVREIMAPGAEHVIVVAPITRVEIISGVMRLKREGALDEHAARAIRQLVDRHASGEYLVTALTDGVVDQAEDLLERYTLRAYDSIQLASALQINAQIDGDSRSRIEFVSADTRLLAAAAGEGLTTIDPNARS